MVRGSEDSQITTILFEITLKNRKNEKERKISVRMGRKAHSSYIKINKAKLGVVVHTFSLSTQEAKTGRYL